MDSLHQSSNNEDPSHDRDPTQTLVGDFKAPDPPSAGNTPMAPAPAPAAESMPAPDRRHLRRAQAAAAARARSKLERDGLIMDTNKSSIVSKRSVEKLYHPDEPEFFRHFVSKFKRRSPLINRGYWLRMKAIEHGVAGFLRETGGKKRRRVVVNLGCGYDPMPFLFLSRHAGLCGDVVFVDVDYPALMANKIGVVEKSEQIMGLIPNFTRTTTKKGEAGLLGLGDNYAIVACDLIDTSPLDRILRGHFHADNCEVAFCFVSEVSTAYMQLEASQAVFRWTASYPDVRVVLLEQHVPDGVDHPFAQTMMAHFDKLRTPLRAAGTMEQMRQRFVAAGYPDEGIDITSLWKLWSDPTFQNDDQRRALDLVEPFDEWEEFALYGSHYFLLTADKRTRPSGGESRSFEASSPRVITNILQVDARSATYETPTQCMETEDALRMHELQEPHDFRRFAAIIPHSASDGTNDSLGLHGGMGTRERIDTCTTYACVDDAHGLHPPPLRSGIMCHTINRLGTTSDCILVGGRTSPDKATAECWVRLRDTWQRGPSLPSARYRHAAVPIVVPNGSVPEHTVLIFGGKKSNGDVLDEWLVWAGEAGWKSVTVVGASPSPRFGAAIISDGVEGLSGVLVGGMTDAGIVINDFWHWELTSDLTLRCRDVTSKATALLQGDACILGRFATQLVRSSRGILMIGGISGERMLTRRDEVLNMKTLRPQPLEGPRPLLVGCSIQDVDGGLIILGGGATCFSFGTTWNRSCMLNDARNGDFDPGWRSVATESPGSKPSREAVISDPEVIHDDSRRGLPEPTKIRTEKTSPELNFAQLLEARRPVVMTGCDIGPCIAKWDTAYLKRAMGAERKVSVHVASSEKMDFQAKNFTYANQDFSEFLDGIDRGERLYLRSLSREAPSDKPTDLAEDFPEIANDFRLPAQLATVIQDVHSSPLRISGPVQMWLHYDVMANVLCQVHGEKRVVLFPPSDVNHLGFEPGASSSSLNVFGENVGSRAVLSSTHPTETIMRPGDVLLIPPMWLHTTAPTAGTSIAVNVFFRNLENGYAAGRDVYGNRDLAAYEKGRRDVAKIVKSFDNLPDDVSGFYLERLAREMLEKARFLSRSMNNDLSQ